MVIGWVQGVKILALKMGCVPFDVNFRMKTVNKLASVAPNDDPEVKGQPMEVKGDTTRIVFFVPLTRVTPVVPPSHSGLTQNQW